jgi:hypothetical protein
MGVISAGGTLSAFHFRFFIDVHEVACLLIQTYIAFVCRGLVATHNARWRSLMVFLMGFFGQMSGNGLGYFNVSASNSLCK